MKKYELIQVKKPLIHWQGILEEWVSLVKRIHEDTKGEYSPYSYRERPNIGVLAAAAIKSGWSALEECPIIKNGGNGRADLMLWKDSIHYQAEAKITCDSFEKLHYEDKVKDRFKKAKNDALALPDGPKSQRIALTFIIPRIEKGENIESGKPNIDNLLEWCMAEKPDLIASVFPGESPRQTGDRNDIGKYSVGVILIGSHV